MAAEEGCQENQPDYGTRTLRQPGSRKHVSMDSRVEVVVSHEEFSTGENILLGFSNMDNKGQEAIKRSLSNAYTGRRKRLTKKCKQEEERSCNPLPLLVLDSTRRSALLSHAFQNWLKLDLDQLALLQGHCQSVVLHVHASGTLRQGSLTVRLSDTHQKAGANNDSEQSRCYVRRS